jgi:hypothetical protein
LALPWRTGRTLTKEEEEDESEAEEVMAFDSKAKSKKNEKPTGQSHPTCLRRHCLDLTQAMKNGTWKKQVSIASECPGQKASVRSSTDPLRDTFPSRMFATIETWIVSVEQIKEWGKGWKSRVGDLRSAKDAHIYSVCTASKLFKYI